MSEAKFFHISASGDITQMPSQQDTLDARKQGGFIWMNYRQPTSNDLYPLIDALGLHPLSVEDALNDNQIPKIEDYPRHTFLLFNAFHYVNNELAIYEIDMFLGEDFLVTVSREKEDALPIFKDLERFIRHDYENTLQGPAFLAHVILDYVVDEKFTTIEAIEEQIDQAEDVIMEEAGKFNPVHLMQLRRDLLSLRKSLFHEREILVKICRRDCRFISEKALFYYRDIYDHLAKFFELTESSRDIVTSLMEMYLSMLNNQMAKSANETNATVRRLTFITTIFMPLSLLAGIGGMSEWSMMTGPENWRIAYPLFLLAMAVIGVTTYYVLNWLEKKRRREGRLEED